MPPQVGYRVPAEGADRDHDHHRDQGRHWNAANERPEDRQQEQQERAGHEGGEPPAPARGNVDDRLSDHRASAHAAEKGGDDVGRSLTRTFALLVAASVGHVVDDLRREQGFQQANRRHGQRVRKNDAQRFPSERYVGQREAR